MGFIIHRTPDMNSNDRIIAFYKKELHASHIIPIAKQQKHYGTKWYRKFVSYNFPSARRYQRIKAIVSNAYKSLRHKYETLSQLGMKI